MNGAASLIKTLIDSGVDLCFANPGTSEMHLVAAMDDIPGMKAVLCLFEGVVSGAADGYGRMAGKPAATLLHVGSGFSNSMANLHNAKRARTPIVNIVGDHASYHLAYDAPLTSDVPGHLALTSEHNFKAESAEEVAALGAKAVALAKEGYLVNILLPANHAWGEGGKTALPIETKPAPKVDSDRVKAIADVLKHNENSCLYMGGPAMLEDGLKAAKRIEKATGIQVFYEYFPARIQRGRGRPVVTRLPYLAEMAADTLKDFQNMITVGARAPVSFFAYPDKPGKLWPKGCDVHELASARENVVAALEELAAYLEVAEFEEEATIPLPAIPEGPMTAESVNAVVANYLPENAVVSDEGNTSMAFSYGFFDGAAPHDWLCLTGGAIGQGLPVAVGAAFACPDSKVLALQADGSAMYTNQSLWTMAREELDVCVVIYNNNSYAILNLELMRVGVENPGPNAKAMLDLSNPCLSWVDLAKGMGIDAASASSTEEFESLFKKAMETKGPYLIEVKL